MKDQKNQPKVTEEIKKEEKKVENKESLVADPAAEKQENVEGTQAPAAAEEKLEEKKEEKKAETKKEISESEKSMNIINGLVRKNPTLKIVPSESKTGWSFFSGKKRLCKLLKTKRGVTLEINVSLPEQFKTMADMENISATVAFKKHLGTMKHLYRANDAKQIQVIMAEAVAIFKKEIEAEKAKEVEEAKTEEKKAANQ
jgi:hypothetical protein